mmetsp:Transcript_120075/g.383306  ORF Transcript_120075/g.383306 Transcript_120075/m.383306 type:complete len:451 (-) Transcript_120075:152-1504(-)
MGGPRLVESPSKVASPDIIGAALARLVTLDGSKLVPVLDERGRAVSCPISVETMVNPVVIADGSIYEEESIERWLQKSKRSPHTNLELEHRHMLSLMPIKGILDGYLASSGVRLPRNLRYAMKRAMALDCPADYYWRERCKRLDELENGIVEMADHIQALQAELNSAIQCLSYSRTWTETNLVKVQAAWRGWRVRHGWRRMQYAVRLQKVFRGWRWRKVVKMARQEREWKISGRAQTFLDHHAPVSYDLDDFLRLLEQCLPSEVQMIVTLMLRRMEASPDNQWLYDAVACLQKNCRDFGVAFVKGAQLAYEERWAPALLPTLCSPQPRRLKGPVVVGKSVSIVLGQLCARGLLPARVMLRDILGRLLEPIEDSWYPEPFHVECACLMVTFTHKTLKALKGGGEFVTVLLAKFHNLLHASSSSDRPPVYSSQVQKQLEYSMFLLSPASSGA